MSGRSAHVRKKKAEQKAPVAFPSKASGTKTSTPILSEFPIAGPGVSKTIRFSDDDQADGGHRLTNVRSHTSDRVNRPQVPIWENSRIEKSSLRLIVDKKSDNIRDVLAKTFSRKKKKNGPDMTATVSSDRSATDTLDDLRSDTPLDAKSRNPLKHKGSAPLLSQSRFVREAIQHRSKEAPAYIGQPPQQPLPPTPEPARVKRWIGNGIKAQEWNSIGRDPDLWDNQADTLVYLIHPDENVLPTASFRLSCRVIDETKSGILLGFQRVIGQKDDDDMGSSSVPLGERSERFRLRPIDSPTPPPIYEDGWEHPPTYELLITIPQELGRASANRYRDAMRNFFAVFCNKPLIGCHFHEILNDVADMMEMYLPPGPEQRDRVIRYVTERGLNDVRNNPVAAISLLAWSGQQHVRWQEGYKEAFVHCCGMYNRVIICPEWKFIDQVTKTIMNRRSMTMQCKVDLAMKRLANFELADMWPKMNSKTPVAQKAFDRVTMFFYRHYQTTHGVWAEDDQWLTRPMVRKLQSDFGVLYDYLVDREVIFDGPNDGPGRVWRIVCPNNPSFRPDTGGFPFTDILAAFDNTNDYEHIPHPYPLLPEPFARSPVKFGGQLTQSVSSEERMNDRGVALSYAESTNVFLFGPNFRSNALVDEFIKFEENDKEGYSDPRAARQGRWVALYAILQTLASLAVDTPGLAYTDDVEYHVCPSLIGTPPWSAKTIAQEESNHIGSHCWIVRHKWDAYHEAGIPHSTTSQTSVKMPTPIRPFPHDPNGDRFRFGVVSPDILTNPSLNQAYKMANGSGSQSISGRSESESSIIYHGAISSRPVGAGATPFKLREFTNTSDLISFSRSGSGSGYAPGIEKLSELPVHEDRNRGDHVSHYIEHVNAAQIALAVRSRHRVKTQPHIEEEDTHNDSQLTPGTVIHHEQSRATNEQDDDLRLPIQKHQPYYPSSPPARVNINKEFEDYPSESTNTSANTNLRARNFETPTSRSTGYRKIEAEEARLRALGPIPNSRAAAEVYEPRGRPRLIPTSYNLTDEEDTYEDADELEAHSRSPVASSSRVDNNASQLGAYGSHPYGGSSADSGVRHKIDRAGSTPPPILRYKMKAKEVDRGGVGSLRTRDRNIEQYTAGRAEGYDSDGEAHRLGWRSKVV